MTGSVVVPRGGLRGHAEYLEHVASCGGPGWDLATIMMVLLVVVALMTVLR